MEEVKWIRGWKNWWIDGGNEERMEEWKEGIKIGWKDGGIVKGKKESGRGRK